jgi:hypothetical protein
MSISDDQVLSVEKIPQKRKPQAMSISDDQVLSVEKIPLERNRFPGKRGSEKDGSR